MNSQKTYTNLSSKNTRNLIIHENCNLSGVYKLTNLLNNKIYVGSSINLSRRFTKYFNDSIFKNNMLICKAINKYGFVNFSLDIEYCPKEQVLDLEQFYLDKLKPEYNILKKAGSSLGYKHTKKALYKIKNRVIKQETLDKMRKLVKNIETRNKISNSLGIKVTVTDIEKNLVTNYNSKTQASKALKVSDSTVTRYIKSKKLLLNKYYVQITKAKGGFHYW